MNDEYRQQPSDELSEQRGEATPPTGKAVDPRNKRHGNVDQNEEEAKDEQDKNTSQQAKREQDRQLDTGEESPS